ncbi:hypothetical protein [Planotetraspora silvatica]|uniref:hypothetical protein n=1 Tax=Planotetraspora silvatica TaxID=234614 RepID=UPI00195059DA|nr:hypothetical protein [Planotetraspora silvatica]
MADAAVPDTEPDQAIGPDDLDALRAAIGSAPVESIPEETRQGMIHDSRLSAGDPNTQMGDSMSETWDDGHYTPDDVIEAADHTAYLSMDDYIHDNNGMEPDA